MFASAWRGLGQSDGQLPASGVIGQIVADAQPVDTPDVAAADVITISTTAARTRTAAELKARLQAAGGQLIVAPDSSDYIVARNDRWQFNLEALPDGRFQITQSNLVAVAAIGIGGLILLAMVFKNR